MTTPIRHVSDTALWVAMYRAMESDRPDAHFRDPFARRMAGERGAAIVQAMPRGRAMAWPMIVRTQVMDEIILRLLGQGVTTVINLACGLDTRAFRLALPASLRWSDVDLPDMIAYRQEHLAGAQPRCAQEHLAADLTDATQRAAALARADGVTLVMTEGLLVYLTAEQVTGLARDIHGQRAVRWWLTDLASPMLLQMLAKRWQPKLTEGNAPMIFGPAEGTAFFEPLGWREAEFRSTWHESIRLKRTMAMAGLWNIVAKFYPKKKRDQFTRMSGTVLLERA